MRTLSLFLLLVSSLAHADPRMLVADFEVLKRTDVDYTVEGVACEQIAKLRLEREFPPSRYEVVTGIAYGDTRNTIGELDAVVFDRATSAAIIVAEVKCRNDLSDARKKATEQQRRFAAAMASPGARQLFFVWTANAGRTFRPEQFMRRPRLEAIAQQGARAAGFDRELNHTLEETRLLRQELLECHRNNRCAWGLGR
jgi:hypothetical protein